MTYQPTLNSRERILLMGPAGTGKSWAAYDMAKQVLEANNTVFVVDNDFSFGRMSEESPYEGDAGDLTVTDCFPDDWEAMLLALENAVESGQRDDMLILDSITPTWQAAQDWYADEVFGKSLDEFFLEQRKAAGQGQAFDGWKDWGVINKVYGRMYRYINRFPGHVVLTAEIDGLGDTEDKDTRSLYGNRRVKPRGQKSLGHRVNTILLTGKQRDGTFTLSTIKDRGREHDRMEDEEYKSFVLSYLVARAGWKSQ